MFFESGSFCFMGVSSNSKVFLSDKDLKANMDPEFGLLVRPSMEIHKEKCQTSTPEEEEEEEDHQFIRQKQLSVQDCDQQEDNKDQQKEQKQSNDNVIVTVPVAPLKLKLEIPSNVGSENDDSNDGFKTPTSLDHKIPPILECPGAPKKAKSKPTMKRKACRRRIVLDLSKELESLFPTPFVVDLGDGGNNKKVKKCTE